MIKISYNKYQVIFGVVENIQPIPLKDWGIKVDDNHFVNLVNDLVTNGILEISEQEELYLNYEDLCKLDDFEYQTLALPNKYPYDIFINIKGSGLKDPNVKITYSFQDFSNNNGSGNILCSNSNRKGALLSGKTNYLLSSLQYKLVTKIDEFNNKDSVNNQSRLVEVAELQNLAGQCGASLSKILVDTEIVAPNKFKFDIVELGGNKYKIVPIVEDIENDKFQKKFNIFPRVRDEYNFRAEDKKVRVLLNKEENEQGNSLKSQFEKLKSKSTYSSEEINEIYNAPTNFWDPDLIDLDDFGERVIELGIYKPKFHPFISPYKSQWLPGFLVEDKIQGSKLVKISSTDDLSELETLFSEAKENKNPYIEYKGVQLDTNAAPAIIKNAEKQLQNTSKPITTAEEEDHKTKIENKVLIIKENTEELDFNRGIGAVSGIDYKFDKIGNLAPDINLKKHQEEGIGWLQTMFNQPIAMPGVLLADDMGLGKTIQVLYFIEWYAQQGLNKPIMVVAPVSLLENWDNEYDKFFPNKNLETVTLWGGKVKEYIIPTNKQQTKENLNVSKLFLTTYETLRKQQIPLALIDWGVVILDEAQKVKTPGTLTTNAAKALKTDFKIAMTGTPVENSLMDLWCIMDFCIPGLLDNAKAFSKKYQTPLKNENVDREVLAANLRGEIGDVLMRRMKTDVAKDLPAICYDKFHQEMPSEQFDIYNNELRKIEDLKETTVGGSAVLQGILNLKSISDHPYLKHYQLENIDTEDLINTSAKLKKVIHILNDIKEVDEKAIIFTENKSMQRVLKRIVGENFKLIPTIINGDTPNSKSKGKKVKLSRQQEIDKYQNKEGFNVIIMSPLAAGFGLNVTGANHVIHYTRHWNPAKEQQATDRAYRIGQEKPVKVYYPLAVAPNNEFNTFDIILNKLLERKSSLASDTLFPTDQIEVEKNELIASFKSVNSGSNELKLNSIEQLDKLQPLYFEAAIALLLENNAGGNAYLTPKSNDKGADIMFFNENQNLLIQVKQSKSALGISSGQEIVYALKEYQFRKNTEFNPQVITNNYFNNNAVELANQNNVSLVDRDTLINWIQKHPLKIDDIDRKMNDREAL